MTLKEFFKPTTSKIVLTLLLLLVFPLTYHNGTICEQCIPQEECPTCNSLEYGPAVYGWWTHWGGDNNEASYAVLQKVVLGLIYYGIPLSYLISCFALLGYKKIRENKK